MSCGWELESTGSAFFVSRGVLRIGIQDTLGSALDNVDTVLVCSRTEEGRLHSSTFLLGLSEAGCKSSEK